MILSNYKKTSTISVEVQTDDVCTTSNSTDEPTKSYTDEINQMPNKRLKLE
jgi:hypothetical protein